MPIDLNALQDATGKTFPTTHPIRKLLTELPWLHGLPAVRELFQLTVILYRDRLTDALGTGAIGGSEAFDAERELLFLGNLTEDVCIGGHAASLPERYRAARREIADLNLRIGASGTTSRQLARFDLAVAELMRAVRLHRPRRQAPAPRTFRDASVVDIRAWNVIAA